MLSKQFRQCNYRRAPGSNNICSCDNDNDNVFMVYVKINLPCRRYSTLILQIVRRSTKKEAPKLVILDHKLTFFWR